jgi:hypothetical protein
MSMADSASALLRRVTMRHRLSMIFLIPLAFACYPACAITLTNHDTTEQKLIVIEGDKQSEKTIKPGEKLELCEKSCVIRLADGEDYEFDGAEIVSLEEGLLFLDTPEEQNKSVQ